MNTSPAYALCTCLHFCIFSVGDTCELAARIFTDNSGEVYSNLHSKIRKNVANFQNFRSGWKVFRCYWPTGFCVLARHVKKLLLRPTGRAAGWIPRAYSDRDTP